MKTVIKIMQLTVDNRWLRIPFDTEDVVDCVDTSFSRENDGRFSMRRRSDAAIEIHFVFSAKVKHTLNMMLMSRCTVGDCAGSNPPSPCLYILAEPSEGPHGKRATPPTLDTSFFGKAPIDCQSGLHYGPSHQHDQKERLYDDEDEGRKWMRPILPLVVFLNQWTQYNNNKRGEGVKTGGKTWLIKTGLNLVD